MNNLEIMKSWVGVIMDKCSSWIASGKDGCLEFIDPIDNVEISSHYGATHTAAALIIWGDLIRDKAASETGIALLWSILDRWNISIKMPAYHFDFNNFALCVAEKVLEDYEPILAEKIRKLVLSTSDSKHFTVNWLPMRAFVNTKRYNWSGEEKFKETAKKSLLLIKQATNEDGGIEDRLPKGTSFNLQYDLATVAVLQYQNVHGEKMNLNKELGFLMNSLAPDGDINYQGRGTNQIFAWGLWVYLLASAGREDDLTTALLYLKDKLPVMLGNDNLLLNDQLGKEKHLWWDYHYASVYIAHFLLWLILAIQDYDKSSIEPVYPTSTETGMHILRTENAFVCWFEGRTEYLAEKGPSIACVWTKKHGIICKGAFAPWQGSFGNRYFYEDVVLKNYCGLLSVKRNKDWSKYKYIHKLFSSMETDDSLTLQPIFCPITVIDREGCVELTWKNNHDGEIIFNLPAVSENVIVELYADGIKVDIYCVESIKNQYGWVFLHQSHSLKCKTIKMVVC